MNKDLLIKAENDRLINGGDIIIDILDPHGPHIQNHATILDDLENRNNAQIVARTLNHIQEHIDMLNNENVQLIQKAIKND
jgi:DNA-binding GntR family transcriptional regulator